MNSTNQFDEIFNKMNKVFNFVSGFALIFLMLFIVLEVFLRNIFSISIPGNYEFSQNYLMPLIVFPTIALTYSLGIIPRITLFTDKIVSKKLKKAIIFIVLLIEFLVVLLVVYYGVKYFIYGINEGLGFTAGGRSYVIYPVLILIPFGFGLLAIYMLTLFWKMFKDKDYLPFE